MTTLQNMSKVNKWKCSKCRTWADNMSKTCPWCGAKKSIDIATEVKTHAPQKEKILNEIYNEIKDKDGNELFNILNFIRGTKSHGPK